MNKIKIGQFGEHYAKLYLFQNFHQILAANFRSKTGEIDIITIELSSNTIIFIEVKTRTNSHFGQPQESISPQKIRKIFLTAQAFFHQHSHFSNYHWRIDAIAVKLNKDYTIQTLNHFLSINE